MRRMREIVRDNNIYRWAGSMLQDAARLRKRNSIQQATENPPQRLGAQYRAHVRQAQDYGHPRQDAGLSVRRKPSPAACQRR